MVPVSQYGRIMSGEDLRMKPGACKEEGWRIEASLQTIYLKWIMYDIGRQRRMKECKKQGGMKRVIFWT
jgi:hypothetical protein